MITAGRTVGVDKKRGGEGEERRRLARSIRVYYMGPALPVLPQPHPRLGQPTAVLCNDDTFAAHRIMRSNNDVYCRRKLC